MGIIGSFNAYAKRYEIAAKGCYICGTIYYSLNRNNPNGVVVCRSCEIAWCRMHEITRENQATGFFKRFIEANKSYCPKCGQPGEFTFYDKI